MNSQLNILPQHAEHSRLHGENRYVYPVLSRRSKGISIGINLNPDKICNFDCVYCQVDRQGPVIPADVDVERMLNELETTASLVASGALFNEPEFENVPAPLRRLNDFAFSGDGEPTSTPGFDEIVRRVAALKDRLGLNDVKLVLITNATLLDRPAVARGVDLLMRHQGEVWAKLEAGTAKFYHNIERTKVPFARVLDNLLQTARRHPLVIQSLFMRFEGEGPSDAEIDAYVGRLEHILANGGKLKLIQVYTVARRPAEASVASLETPELERIAARVRAQITTPVEVYPGKSNASPFEAE